MTNVVIVSGCYKEPTSNCEIIFSMTDRDKWKILSSKYLLNDRWLKLRADSAQTPDGHLIEPYYVVEQPIWINCLAIDKDLNALLHQHYRHGVQEYILEIVSGIAEKGETPEEAVKRELKEELGYKGGRIIHVGTSFVNPANQTNKVYSFLAIGGVGTTETSIEKGETLSTSKFPIDEAFKRFLDQNKQETFQSMHITNIFFALQFLKNSDDGEFDDLKSKLSAYI